MNATHLATSLFAQVTNNGGGGLFAGIPCFGGIIGLAALVLWIWALVDVLQNRGIDGNSRLIWVIVIILLPFIGSILYFVIGRKR